MYSSYYEVHVVCDHPAHDAIGSRAAEFAGNTKKEAFAKAKDCGWDLNSKSKSVICPSCMNREKKAREGFARVSK